MCTSEIIGTNQNLSTGAGKTMPVQLSSLKPTKEVLKKIAAQIQTFCEVSRTNWVSSFIIQQECRKAHSVGIYSKTHEFFYKSKISSTKRRQ